MSKKTKMDTRPGRETTIGVPRDCHLYGSECPFLYTNGDASTHLLE